MGDTLSPAGQGDSGDSGVSLTAPTVADLAQALAALASIVCALVVLPQRERKGLGDDAAGIAEVCQEMAAACRPPA